MSSYHTSFSYLNKNSLKDYNLIISHIENSDVGEVESYLSLTPVYHDSYRGTKRHLYGTKYSNVALLSITVLRNDYDEFTIEQTRNILSWLTGSQQYTWLDLLIEDEIKYRMHCYVQDVKPYKMDSRIIGFTIYVESSSPWCYSPLKTINTAVAGNKPLTIICQSDDIYNYVPLNIEFTKVNETGLLFDQADSELTCIFSNAGFSYDAQSKVTVCSKNALSYNSSDKILTFNTSKVAPIPKSIDNFIIRKTASNEQGTEVHNISDNEIITISENLIIQSDKPQRNIFGNDFNYVFPKISSGANMLKLSGYGYVTIQYVEPVKTIDCIHDYMMEENNKT